MEQVSAASFHQGARPASFPTELLQHVGARPVTDLRVLSGSKLALIGILGLAAWAVPIAIVYCLV